MDTEPSTNKQHSSGGSRAAAAATAKADDGGDGGGGDSRSGLNGKQWTLATSTCLVHQAMHALGTRLMKLQMTASTDLHLT
jgi:hypothetical protein